MGIFYLSRTIGHIHRNKVFFREAIFRSHNPIGNPVLPGHIYIPEIGLITDFEIEIVVPVQLGHQLGNQPLLYLQKERVFIETVHLISRNIS